MSDAWNRFINAQLRYATEYRGYKIQLLMETTGCWRYEVYGPGDAQLAHVRRTNDRAETLADAKRHVDSLPPRRPDTVTGTLNRSLNDNKLGMVRLERDALKKELSDAYTELAQLKATRFVSFNADDCWVYMGDGTDKLDSLVCPVVIDPKTLKELVAARDRLLVIASKHCPQEHHDWQELTSMHLRCSGDAEEEHF